MKKNEGNSRKTTVRQFQKVHHVRNYSGNRRRKNGSEEILKVKMTDNF